MAELTTGTKRKLASVAIEQLETRGEKIDGDRQELAEYYVQEAYDSMAASQGGYDPIKNAPQLAERVAVAACKSQLLGKQPDGVTAYENALRRWRRKAAVEVVKEQVNEDREEDKEIPRA